MPAVKTGMTPPPMPGMPAPMQPMGGVPPMQNPFAPMPPMPLAGMPPPPVPPMPVPPVPQTAQGQQMMGSNAGRRRRFGDALEGMLGRNQGIGAGAGWWIVCASTDGPTATDGCAGYAYDADPESSPYG